MVHVIPADPSLTVSRIRAAVETVEGWRLEDVLEVPFSKKQELEKQSTTDEDYKRRLSTYYLHTHPRASWAHIGGELLWREKEEALKGVKEHIVPQQGMAGSDYTVPVVSLQ